MTGLTPDDEDLLRAARAGLNPTRADRERIKRALLLQVGASAGLFAGLSGSLKASLTGARVMLGGVAGGPKVAATLLLVAALAAPAALVLRPSRTNEASRAPTPPIPTAQTRATAARSSAASPTTSPASAAPSPTLLPRVIPVASPLTAPVDRALGPASNVPSAMPKRAAGEGPPPARAELKMSGGEASPVPCAAPAPNAPPSTPSSLASAPTNPDRATTVGTEASLLRQANAALQSGDATRALGLLDAYAAKYPHGVLEEERSAEHIAVLCVLGRSEQARDEARTFLRDHGESALALRVRASCGAP